MLSILRTAAVLITAMTVLTGLAYPLTVTGLASTLLPWQAGGSLITRDGVTVGSALIGQSITTPGYLQGRPSAAGNGYDATASGASNLAPSSAVLADTVSARLAALRAANPDAPVTVPSDLVLASGSGLDPHISPEAALWQAPRIARARSLSVTEVESLFRTMTEERDLGVLGDRRINVLQVNLALDALWPLPDTP